MPSSPDTVFFLSDYGTRDEFAGVVRAVIRRNAAHAAVIDLTHDVAPFDVVSGARTLERAVPHLGDGVVLAVVDPGVGSERRAIALSVKSKDRPRFFVGPDNGLLLGGAELSGDLTFAVELSVRDGDASMTFDGRDVFAPAAAALCNGVPLDELGRRVELAGLVRLAPPLVTRETLGYGRSVLWCEVTWVDHFGNLQLAASVDERETETCELHLPQQPGRILRRVSTFSELVPGEPGLIVDANGRLAVVVREGSASELLGVAVGAIVGLSALA